MWWYILVTARYMSYEGKALGFASLLLCLTGKFIYPVATDLAISTVFLCDIRAQIHLTSWPLECEDSPCLIP